MDKETLIRLATPASIALLATSIFSFPLVSKAVSVGGTKNNPVHVACVKYSTPYTYSHTSC